MQSEPSMRQPGRCFLTWVLAFRDPALLAWLGFSEQGGLGWDLTGQSYGGEGIQSGQTQIKEISSQDQKADFHSQRSEQVLQAC